MVDVAKRLHVASNHQQDERRCDGVVAKVERYDVSLEPRANRHGRLDVGRSVVDQNHVRERVVELISDAGVGRIECRIGLVRRYTRMDAPACNRTRLHLARGLL